jgi:hypothetical protein
MNRSPGIAGPPMPLPFITERTPRISLAIARIRSTLNSTVFSSPFSPGHPPSGPAMMPFHTHDDDKSGHHRKR